MAVNLYALIETRPGHPSLGAPFYIGIGTSKRPYKHLAQSRSKAGHRNLRLHEVLVSHRALGITPGVEILGVFPDKATAGEAEKEAIRRHGRLGIDEGGTLCNLASGGQGPDSELMRLPEVRERNRQAQLRRPRETLESLIAAGRANSIDPQINAVRAAASTNANNSSWADPEIRARRIAAMKGKKKTMTAEAIAARQANARTPKSEEALAAQRAAVERNWADPEFRAKRSRNQAAAWKDPEKRANMLAGRSEGIAQSWRDPAVRKRRTTGIKASANKHGGAGEHC